MKQTFKFLTLFLLTLLGTSNLWADPTWMGNSYIVVNNTWYNGSGNGNETPGDIGAITSLTLTGQIQTYGDNDGASHPVTMYYKIDDGSSQTISLTWQKYASNNNHFGYVDNKGVTPQTIDLSGLAAGSHTLAVWFNSSAGSLWDSNNGNNYNFSFTYNKTLSITYKDKGGSDFSGSHETNYPTTHTYGTATTLKTATKTGYTFDGWFTNSNCTGSAITTLGATTYTTDITLYAQWTAKTYKLAWVTDGDNLTGDYTHGDAIAYGTSITAPDTPTKTGYTFAGWSDGSSVVTPATTMPDNDLTYTATWTANTHKLSWVTDGDDLTGDYTHGDAIAYGTTIVAPETPTKTGYDFAGWSDGSSVVIPAAAMPDNDLTYTATWTEKSFAVSISADKTVDNGATVSPTGSQTIKWFNGTQVTATPSSAAYVFDHWEKTSDDIILSGSSATVTVTAHGIGTLTAYFRSAASYKLTVDVNPSAAFTAHSESVENITLGTPYDISATLAAKGYTFTGWTAEPAANATFGNKDELSTTVTVNNGSVTVTANATAKTTTLTLHGNGGSPNEQVITATYDQPCPSFTTPERTGYTYGGFTTEGTSSIVINQNGTFPNSGTYGKSGNLWGYTTKDALDIYAKWTATHSNQIELNKNFTSGSKRTGERGTAYITFDATAFDDGFTHATSSVGFTLLGYSTDAEGTNMVVNADGTFKTSVTNYTDENGKWINPTFPAKLYAQWEEFMTTVALSANPEGAGKFYVSNSLATEAIVGISTTKAVRTAAIDENAYTFTSWTATNCSVENPASASGGQLSGDGTNATGTLVANFSLIPCNLVQLDAAKTSKTAEAKNTFVMQYDNDKKAYYVDVTPDASPFYFYFNYNEHKYSTDWKDKWQGGYTSGAEVSVSLGVTPTKATIMNDAIDGWDDLPSIVSKACSSYPIRVWFDYNNKKTWITADAEAQWSIAGSEKLGGWSTSQNVMTHAGASSVLWNLTVALDAKKGYTLKVVNRATGEYYGGTNTITKDKTTTDELGTDPAAADITLTTTVAGNYQFQWSTGTKKLTVTYPTSYAVNFGKGTGGATVTAKIDNTTNITTGELVISGSSVTFEQTAATGYTFKEWNTKQDGTGNQLSTDASYTTTINATTNVYAIYTENMHTNIAVVSNDNNKGTVNVTSVEFGITTGATIIATPKAGYYVASWTLPEHAVIASGEGTGTITVKASGDEAVAGTITANFAERWGLVGSLDETDNPHGGMPGWTDANASMFTVSEGVISLDLTLEPNKTYKFQIYDKKSTSRHGCSADGDASIITMENQPWTLDNSKDVRLRTVGHGTYTFTINNEDADPTDPKISYSAPASHKINMDTKTTSEGCASASPGTGGTLTAVDGESYPISDGKYVINNGSVTFTATAYNGYSFEGFYSDATCETQLQAATAGTTYTISNIQENKSVYAKFTERLYNVTYNNGETTTTIQAGIASHPEITAVQKDGRKFTGWETYGVGVANSIAKTTTISYVDMGVNDHRVTATYGDLDVIYFNNQISGTWDPTEMYVYFYKGAYPNFDDSGAGSQWNGGNTWAPTCMMKKGIPMTKIEGTNIWKAEYDKEDLEYFAYSSEDIKMVAFNDHRQDTYDRFTNASIVYVDFNSCMNMYVQDKTEGFNKKGTGAYYRNNGFWKNYETDNSGLFVNIYGGGDDRLSSTPVDQQEGDGWFSASVHLEPQGSSGEYDYYFIIGGCDGNNWSHKNGVVSKDANTITLHPYYKGENVYGEKVTIKTTAPGSYKFMVKHNDNNELELKVEYPFNVNDYRVVSVINGKAHDNGYFYKYSSTEKDDLASFFVKEGMTVKLQKCTAIAGLAVTWSDVPSQSIDTFTVTCYRNFTIHQDGNGNVTLAAAGEYEGKFYLRTDVAPGGWSNYLTNAGNIMQENEYGMNDAQSFKFTHAYTNHVGHGGNVKFVIANDYSKCITDTLVKDDFITENSGNLPSGKDANVRFMWNKNTNETKRAYIGGSALTTDRYLVLFGNKQETKSLMVDESGNAFPEGGTGRDGLHADEAIFTDLGNWIYQVNIKAFSGAAVKLMADFNGHTQYFVGAAEGENAWRTIMAGSETENPYTIQVVYDFKSNRLVAGFVPEGQEISSDIVLNGDLLILREMQKDAKQIKFGEAAQGQNPYSISQIDHIYCGLQINKGYAGQNDGMIGSTNNDYAKTMYWISFPFDVNINEIFGLDGYGQKWIIQKYNGAERASKGWFKGDGTKTFWEFMDYNETMKAYEGYLFLLDANYFNETNDKVWEIGTVDHITFYFPSASGEIGIINKSSYPQSVPDHECKIDREFEVQGVGTVNHKITDSHWNVIGVPAFQNKMMALGTETETDMKAIYEWDSSDNTYDVKALSTDFEFKTMYAYMTQFYGTINWTNVSVVSKPTTAPYRYADEKNYMIELFFNGNNAEDHTYINLADEASTDFVLNEDMMKIDNAGFPNIYSFAGNYNVAYNETKRDNQTVMLGVSAPKDGNYTFAMPKDFSGTAKLIDLVEGITTDLNVANYSVDLNKGSYNNRFQLVLEVEAKTPTSIEADGQRGREADGKTTKLLRNGNIYLINGGRVYNVLGVEE